MKEDHAFRRYAQFTLIIRALYSHLHTGGIFELICIRARINGRVPNFACLYLIAYVILESSTLLPNRVPARVEQNWWLSRGDALRSNSTFERRAECQSQTVSTLPVVQVRRWSALISGRVRKSFERKKKKKRKKNGRSATCSCRRAIKRDS